MERFALGNLLDIRPVSQAWSNEVFRVRTDQGEYAVKLFPADLPAGRLPALRAAMTFEAAVLDSGLVPMPRPVDADGSWLAEVPTPAGTRLVRCHEWVDGTAATATPLAKQEIGHAGHTLGVLHAFRQAAGDSSQLPGLDRERWERAVAAAHEAGFAWAGRLAALTPVVDDLASQVEQVRAQRRPMRFSHRDFDPKNAVVLPDHRLAITDWDYAGPVLAEVELVVSAMSFADPADPDGSVRAFVSAYRDAGGDAEPSDPLGLAVEAADVDWLLRNAEAGHPRVDELIAEYERGTAGLRAWAERVAVVT